MSGAEQFRGNPRPDQKGQQQEKRVTMNNISFVVVETFGGLKPGSNTRQAFEPFTKRALAKKIFDNSMGADAIAKQKWFEEADSAVTAAKADLKLNLALGIIERKARKWQQAIKEEITKLPVIFPDADQKAENIVTSRFVYAIGKINAKENSPSQIPQGK